MGFFLIPLHAHRIIASNMEVSQSERIGHAVSAVLGHRYGYYQPRGGRRCRGAPALTARSRFYGTPSTTGTHCRALRLQAENRTGDSSDIGYRLHGLRGGRHLRCTTRGP
jgi:hypothetical protein